MAPSADIYRRARTSISQLSVTGMTPPARPVFDNVKVKCKTWEISIMGLVLCPLPSEQTLPFILSIDAKTQRW